MQKIYTYISKTTKFSVTICIKTIKKADTQDTDILNKQIYLVINVTIYCTVLVNWNIHHIIFRYIQILVDSGGSRKSIGRGEGQYYVTNIHDWKRFYGKLKCLNAFCSSDSSTYSIYIATFSGGGRAIRNPLDLSLLVI